MTCQRKKERGAPTSPWGSPPAPQIPPARVRVRAGSPLQRSQGGPIPRKTPVPVDKRKRHPPRRVPLTNGGYQGGAPTAGMSAFLASFERVSEDGGGRGPLPDQAAICTHRCGGVTPCCPELSHKKCCPQRGGSKVGRFAAPSLDP